MSASLTRLSNLMIESLNPLIQILGAVCATLLVCIIFAIFLELIDDKP